MNVNEVTLKLDVNSLNVILASVRKAPWEVAHPVLMLIEEQLRAQMAAAAAPPAPVVEAPNGAKA